MVPGVTSSSVVKKARLPSVDVAAKVALWLPVPEIWVIVPPWFMYTSVVASASPSPSWLIE